METVFLLEAITEPTQDWMDENVSAEPYQFMGKAIAVEHGYIGGIVTGMMEAGFNPGVDFKVS